MNRVAECSLCQVQRIKKWYPTNAAITCSYDQILIHTSGSHVQLHWSALDYLSLVSVKLFFDLYTLHALPSEKCKHEITTNGWEYNLHKLCWDTILVYIGGKRPRDLVGSLCDLSLVIRHNWVIWKARYFPSLTHSRHSQSVWSKKLLLIGTQNSVCLLNISFVYLQQTWPYLALANRTKVKFYSRFMKRENTILLLVTDFHSDILAANSRNFHSQNIIAFWFYHIHSWGPFSPYII